MKAFFYTTRLGARAWFLLGIIMAAGMLQTASATTRTFTGGGLWTDTARWTPGNIVPVNGDDVIIDGNVTNTASTALLSSYTLDGTWTHTFAGTNTFLYATNVFISGLMTHAAETATAAVGGVWYPDSLLQIVAALNVTVTASGNINVNNKGYQGGPSSVGYGPGGGSYQRAGGGYGGKGGPGYQSASGGNPYGSLTAPVDPGSGGGFGGVGGSPGGGAVYIQAGGKVTVSGSSGGGSGGSIYIVCGSFDGNGSISARTPGFSSSGGGGGGGGRVAINYTNAGAQALLTPTVQFNLGGRMGQAATAAAGQMGTLWLASTNFFPLTTMVGGGQITIPGFTNWNPNSLTITTNGDVGFAGLVINVTTGGIVVINGGELVLSNSALTCGNLTVGQSSSLGRLSVSYRTTVTCGGNLLLTNNGTMSVSDHTTVTCGGDLVLTNNGTMYIYSGLTSNTPPDVAETVTVGGTLFVATNCYLYLNSHPTNGGSTLFNVANFTVASGGVVSAVGYAGAGSAPNYYGYGPGYSGGSGGASYGGLGTAGPYSGTPGIIYGLTNTPVEPGSGGGNHNGNGGGGSGGGLVRINATQNVTVDGTIMANGLSGYGSNQPGNGSGGGIYIRCRVIFGAGSLQANGANGGGNGAGGGGRIAVWCLGSNYVGTVAVNGGLPGSAGAGSPGTIFWGLLPIPKGTLIMIR